MAVALVTHRDYRKHITGPSHPERPQRLQAIVQAIESSELSGLSWLTPEPMAREQLVTVHTEAHLDRIEALARAGGGYLDPDTVISPDSYDVARLAAGGAALAISSVLEGRTAFAFALVRPPGHHASADEGMGFCLFNNVAVASTVAKAEYGLQRIFLIDWDVHHGNGTQAIFYRDRSVLYLSLHQENWYPGTGHWEEVGEGEGEGFTVNIPLPAETGDEGYKLLFEEVVIPLGERFAPELIVISAGYDAHFDDPLGGMLVTAPGFRTLTELVLSASRAGSGKVAAVLEGGYNLVHLPRAVLATLQGFTGVTSATGEETSQRAEAPYHLLRERARRARSIVRTYWNI